MQDAKQQELERAVIDAARDLPRAYDGYGQDDTTEAINRAVIALEAYENEEIFVPIVWADVRENDTVRLTDPQGVHHLAYVASAMHLGWRVDPESNTYRPEALEWSAVRVTLHDADDTAHMLGQWDMDPRKPIEIMTTRLEARAVDLLGGWVNRIGLIIKEENKP